jgi:hypothetical protein
MTEPTYEFVKGQGWILSQSMIFTDQDGNPVRVIDRKPDTGDVYLIIGRSQFQSDGTLDPAALASYLKRCQTKYFGNWETRGTWVVAPACKAIVLERLYDVRHLR